VFAKGGKAISQVVSPEQYKKQLTPNTFEQREFADSYLNFDAKPLLFNDKINPMSQKVYTSPDGKDIVNIPSYNTPEFVNSLYKQPVQAQVPVVQGNATPTVVPKTNIVAGKPTVKKQTVVPVSPVTDTLEKQKYGMSDIQKFKTVKTANKELLKDKKAQSNFDSFMKERTNQKAYGGELDGNGNPLDPLNPNNKLNTFGSQPQPQFNYNGMEFGLPGARAIYDRSNDFPNGIYQSPETNIDYNIMAYKSPVSGQYGEYDNSNNFPNGIYKAPEVTSLPKVDKNGKKIDYSKVRDSLTNSLRYAPILGNALQKANIGPAEVESAIKNPYQYKKQYIDEAAYRNAADQQSALTMEALNKSGLSGNQLMAASLGSQLERTRGVSEGAMAAKMHNLNENKIAEQVKQQNEGDFVADKRRINDVNAQNRANRDTQISKFDSEIYNSLGAIGKEETFKKMAETMTGYDWMGKYLKQNPNATPEEADKAYKADEEKKKKDATTYKKGGMMDLKFKKY